MALLDLTTRATVRHRVVNLAVLAGKGTDASLAESAAFCIEVHAVQICSFWIRHAKASFFTLH